MTALSLPALQRLAPLAPVALRIVAGAVFMAYGWQKLTVMGASTFGSDMLGGLGLPAPVALGYLVTWLELVGGAMLIIGLLSRVLAVVFTLELVAAIALVKLDLGFIAAAGAPLPGSSFDLAVIAALLGVALLGPGRPSVDHAVGLEGTEPVAEPAPARHATRA